MAARRLWRSVRTPVAIAVNALALTTFALIIYWVGLLDLHAHRAVAWKVLPVMWFLGCLFLSVAAVYRLRVAAAIRDRGARGRALGVASTARGMLYVSGVLALAPIAVLAALYLYLWLLPIPRG